MQSCRRKRRDLSNEDLNKEFEKMWTKLVSELSNVRLQRQDVQMEALNELKSDFEAAGKSGHVSKNLTMKYFKAMGQKQFVVSSNWISFHQIAEGILKLDMSWYRRKTQNMCDSIIAECEIFVSDKVKSNKNYQKTHIKEVLKMIDDKIAESQKELSVCEECECELKFHICWKAAVQFQEMHDRFIRDKDPKICLEESKEKFLEEFIDLFRDKDQCLKAVAEFTKDCLSPAVGDYITKRLGTNIADEMMTGDGGVDYSTRTHFQFALLAQLLEEDNFEKFKQYTCHYKKFVNDWILDRIIETFSKDDKWQGLKLKHLSEVVHKITDAINQVKKDTEENTDMKMFTQKICAHLKDQLTFQEDAVFIMGKDVNTEQFANNLIDFLSEMKQTLTEQYSCSITEYNLMKAIRQLPSKPHELLFTRLGGCGHQCPFCGTPCEAGGKDHKTHFSSMHWPKGLIGIRFNKSQKLLTDICTTAVISDETFQTPETKGKYHPYKKYREIYPDWEIAGYPSVEASYYWKYVFMKYNKQFAEHVDALPADIPDAWKELTPTHAKIGLKKSFNI